MSTQLENLQYAIVDWANSISLGREPKDTVIKMVSETSELLDAVFNRDKEAVAGELADCMILLLDITDMYGIDIIRATWDKLDVNRQRKWINENGVIRRVRDEHTGEAQVAAGQAVSDLFHEQGAIGSGAQLQRGDDSGGTRKGNGRRKVPG